MAETVPHRDLRNRSSEILRRVQEGESFEITNHGEVVAVLVPPRRPADEGLRVKRATRVGGFTAPTRVLDHRVQESVDELRGER